MAKGNAVWGIDIGQCSLKAIRCTYDARAQQVVADTCDFIEYEKILSQPDADPETLVRDAIKEFLSRNSVRGDSVAISVAGQQGLARFIKLPPVEAKKRSSMQRVRSTFRTVLTSRQPRRFAPTTPRRSTACSARG